MHSDYSTDHLFPYISPSPWACYSLRHNNFDIGPINNPIMPVKCSSERNGCMSLTLNQKPEMIKLREKGMSKVEISWNLCLLTNVSQVSKGKKFLKEIKCAVLVNTKMTRKWDRFIANMKKVLGLDGRSSQPQHYLKLKPIQSKASPPFNFMKAEESWRRKAWDSRGCSGSLKKEAIFTA